MITFERTGKRFGNLDAVKDFSITIKDGEILGLLGPNGAGKTTLMLMMGTVYRPTSGTITVNGFDVGCSCMLVFLAAANEGLASSFAGSVGIFKPGLLRKELGIPQHYEPVGVLSLGYPDLASEVPSQSLKRGRRPLKDFVHYENW